MGKSINVTMRTLIFFRPYPWNNSTPLVFMHRRKNRAERKMLACIIFAMTKSVEALMSVSDSIKMGQIRPSPAADIHLGISKPPSGFPSRKETHFPLWRNGLLLSSAEITPLAHWKNFSLHCDLWKFQLFVASISSASAPVVKVRSQSKAKSPSLSRCFWEFPCASWAHEKALLNCKRQLWWWSLFSDSLVSWPSLPHRVLHPQASD